MNPELDTTPGLGLPQPSVGMGQGPSGRVPETFRAPEVAPPRFEAIPPGSSAPAGPMSQPFSPVAQPQQQVTGIPVAPIQSTVIQDEDSDDTALDAEWVNKAREVVERTHTDPYLQSKELGLIKAQFIKARYNKEI